MANSKEQNLSNPMMKICFRYFKKHTNTHTSADMIRHKKRGTYNIASLIPFSTRCFRAKTTLETKVDLKIGSIKDTSFDRFPSKNNFLSKSCM